MSFRVYELRELNELSPTHKTQHLSTSAPQHLSNSTTLRFEVTDTGIGIPKRQLTSIFLPFHQVNTPLVPKEGTGLGLAISRRLVRMMGGELSVKSTVGQGSTFWFEIQLPLTAREDQSQGKSDSSERRIIGFTGQPRKILIVDDEELNRQLLTDILTPLGFEIAEAVDGQDALEKIEIFSPDLVLLDLVMSGIDGFEVVRRIRNTPTSQGVRIIAVSASAFRHTHRKSLRAGCDDFIAKPLRVKDLLEKLHHLLDLEWRYEPLQQGSENETILPFISPPPQVLEVLLNLTIKGHLRKILDYLDEIEHSDPRFVPFIKKIRQFAKGFQMDRMCTFLQEHIHKE